MAKNGNSRLYKIYHHISRSRPQWYRDYHKWKYSEALHWITFTFSSIVIVMGFLNAVMLIQSLPLISADAATGTTTVTQEVNAGTLNLSSSASTNLSAVNVNVTTPQNSTGNLGDVTVTDNRGSGVGWSATATSSHFYVYNSPVMTGGSNNTVTINTGTSTPYSSTTVGTYTVNITGGGGVGVATYSVTGPGPDNNSGTTSGDAQIGSRGLRVAFGAATYTVSDSWTIRVDVIPVTNLQITPNSFTTIAGSSTGVSNGGAHTFSGTNDPATIMTASSGYGMGSYSDNPALQLSVPAASFANSYTATVTETVN